MVYKKVNGFNIEEAVKEIDPDLVVQFGTWRNVHDDDTLDRGGFSSEFRPSAQERYKIGSRQAAVFKGDEMVTSVLCSGLVHARKASWLNVAPQKYIRDVKSNRDRPEVLFHVDSKECHNSWYQGVDQHTDYMGWFFPKDITCMPKIDRHGQASCAEIVLMHKKVLIISAGRCDFWSHVFKVARQKRLRQALQKSAVAIGCIVVMTRFRKMLPSLGKCMVGCLTMGAIAAGMYVSMYGAGLDDAWGDQPRHLQHQQEYQKLIVCDRCGDGAQEHRDQHGFCQRCLWRIRWFYGYRQDPRWSKERVETATKSERECAMRLLRRLYVRCLA